MLKSRTLPTGWHDLDPGSLDLTDPVHACCHGSRLLGREPSFVLHGGGNTSVKHRWNDITGRTVEALYVKGSGWDLATIEPAGFAPLRLSRLHELLDLDRLSDTDMARELAAAKLDPAAPQPSVEALLHAYLPYPAVQHSHADAIVAMTNTVDGEANCREIYGDDVVVIPYVMPGFDLAREVRNRWPQQAGGHTAGMVLLNHGLFTFGPDTEQALARHVELIERCEAWLRDQHAATATSPPPAVLATDRIDICQVRAEISAAAERPMITTVHQGPDVAAFLGRKDWHDLARRGPLTPDHVLRTKRLPQIGRDVAAYGADYRRYFENNQERARQTGSVIRLRCSRIVRITTMSASRNATSSSKAILSECTERAPWMSIAPSRDERPRRPRALATRPRAISTEASTSASRNSQPWWAVRASGRRGRRERRRGSSSMTPDTVTR